jgi:hypothetical protein
MSRVLSLALALALACGVAAVVRAPLNACGTAKVDLSCLKNSQDYTIPVGSPCSAAECGGGKLPWNIFVNMCQPVQTQGPMTINCVGAAVCEQWVGDSASLGQFAQVSYQDISGGVLVTGLGGTMADGTARSFQLSILCSNTSADPWPTFVSEDPTSLTYKLTWNRPEACGAGCGKSAPTAAPSPPSPPCDGCDTCWKAINYCVNATTSCSCFDNAATCFGNANCNANSVPLLKAELSCARRSCSASSNGNCTF